jgi:uncharacterized protein DUF4333
MTIIRRGLAALGLAVALGAALAGCSTQVTQDDVESAIDEQLRTQGVTAKEVSCPDDLDAEVGATVRCEFTVEGGAPIGADAKVTSLQGEQVNFDIAWAAPLVSPQDVAAAIDEQVAGAGVAADSPATCPGALIGETGRSVRCEVSVDGQPIGATATVTAVNGTETNFDIEFE